MGIFNKKITLYIESDYELNWEGKVADLVSEYEGKWIKDWLIGHENGKWEQKCNCGAADCKDAEVLQ